MFHWLEQRPFFFTVVLFLFVALSSSFPQNSGKTAAIGINDSTKEIHRLNYIKEFEFYDFGFTPYNNAVDGNIWTKTFGTLNNYNYIAPSVSKNMLAPLRLQFMDSQKFSIFREILGAAQMTAVGIMAYQHIKRYGFIKQRKK